MSTLIKKALYFSAECHDGQYRKGGKIPHFAHPALVALEVSKYTDDEKVIAAALLHDTLEDCREVIFPVLKKEFGTEIAEMVEQVSLPPEAKYDTWKEKRWAYLEKIKRASKNSLLIVAVDKMVNMDAYFEAHQKNPDVVNGLFSGSKTDYIWYYSEVFKILYSSLQDHKLVKDYEKILRRHKINPTTY